MNKINLIYPGSFDPFHGGHLDVIRRLHNHFGNYINLKVLIQHNRFKGSSMFSEDFKYEFISDCIKRIFPEHVSVSRTDEPTFSGYWYTTNACHSYLLLVIGDDTLATVHKWNDFDYMIKGGMQLVVVQRNLSYKEISNFKDSLPVHTIVPHDKESTRKCSSTYVREQVFNVLKKNMY